ncbi:MAG: hypothetical protein RR790_07705 [Eubacterium sp.]
MIDDVIQELEKVLQNEAVNKNKMLREELTDVKRKMTKISDDY